MRGSLRAPSTAPSFSLLRLGLRRALPWLAAPFLALGAAAQNRCAAEIRYGLNPSFQTWSSRAIVFADAFQRVRSFSLWNDAPQGPAPLIPLGSGRLGEGWPDPGQLGAFPRFGAYLFGSMEGTVPDGRGEPYVVTWKGAGSVRLEGPFVASERDRGPDRVEVFIDPTRGNPNGLLSVSWTATDPSDPVRDIHVWLPEMEHSDRIFWPPFLEHLRVVNAGSGPSTWRTLDWTRMNEYGRPLSAGGFLFDLAGVITPASPSQGTPRGVATAYQVALCNELGMDLHIQFPHRTDDLPPIEYARFLVEQLLVIRDGAPGVPGLRGGRPFAPLAPGLTVTVELSNEIWNSSFPVNRWMNEMATRLGLSFAAQVAREIELLFRVASALFTGPDSVRLRRYIGGFAADPGYLRRVLANLPADLTLDALGPAGYLGPRRPDLDAWLAGSVPGSCPNCPTADELLASATNAVDVLRPLIAEHRDLAATWKNPDGSNPALELYEGGLNLKSVGRPWLLAAQDLQDDPRLFELFVERYVPMLVSEGVELVNWYSFMTDQDSPTVDAFGFWNDMRQPLTLPVTKPYVHEGAPKAAVLALGPPLASACPTARATARHAPGNPAIFTTTLPVLGSRLRASVALGTTTFESAFVVTSLDPASILLSTGQTLLTSLDRADFLELKSGPLATWEVPIPNDPRLAGVEVHSQAFLIRAGASLGLSNAMDLVLGR